MARTAGANTLVWSQAICPMPPGIKRMLRIGQIGRSIGRICPYGCVRVVRAKISPAMQTNPLVAHLRMRGPH